MRCFDERRVPVLTTLAREFAVCTRWFSSVPGETWPNRNFAHAATSHGTVDIEKKPYFDKTIFQQLSKEKRSWAVYHDGPAQIWAFPKLWDLPWRNRFKGMERLYRAIKKDRLPHYAFVEPNHGLILNRFLESSNSQHPSNNLQKGRDFLAGECLIADIYSALRANPEVFRKTLFVITYDEHGGFFDHVHPPTNATPPDPNGQASKTGFKFDLLGVRVPAVLVSPWIPANTVDPTTYDHSSIVKTVREVFASNQSRLTERDNNAQTFHHNLSLGVERTALPGVHPLTEEEAAQIVTVMEDKEGEAALAAPGEREFDSFQESLIELTAEVENALENEAKYGSSSIIRDLQWWGDRGKEVRRRFANDWELFTYLEHITKVFHKMVDSESFALSTRDGDVIDRPDFNVVREAFREALGAGEAESCVSLCDPYDRSLTVYGSGKVVFIDLETGEDYARDGLREEEVAGLADQLRRHEIEAVQRTLRGDAK